LFTTAESTFALFAALIQRNDAASGRRALPAQISSRIKSWTVSFKNK
jgi:hypothetical protein